MNRTESESKSMQAINNLPEWLHRGVGELVNSGCVKSDIPLDKKALAEKLLALLAEHYKPNSK